MKCPSGKHGYRTIADTMRGCRDGHRRPYRCRTCEAWHLGRGTAPMPDQHGARG
ncbi:MAG: hypothetical protein KGN38_05050 [Actinomycetales bacterium]|jgi:hypothetical protein|nr:hypothetical protein [Actinomycetales bacterium]